MKSQIFFSCALAIGATGVHAAVIEKRQFEPAYYFMQSVLAAKAKQAMAPVTAVSRKSETYPDALRNRTTWGPFTLQPSTGTHATAFRQHDKQSDMVEVNMKGFCDECVVLQARAEVTDKDGNRLSLKDGVYTHHIVAVDASRGLNQAPIIPADASSLKCAAGKMWDQWTGKTPAPGATSGGMMHGHGMKRSPQSSDDSGWFRGMPGAFSIFIAKGNEGDSSIFAVPGSSSKSAVKSGYWFGKNDVLLTTAEVVNYNKVPKEVYMTLDYDYVPTPGPRNKEYLDVGFGVIIAEQCADMNLHPPADAAVTYNSTMHAVYADGYIVSLLPHLHDGGLNMKILINGKAACESKAVYGQDQAAGATGVKFETIMSYDPCFGPIKVKAGDTMQVTADYDVRKHKLRPSSAEAGAEAEGMAIGLLHYALDPK